MMLLPVQHQAVLQCLWYLSALNVMIAEYLKVGALVSEDDAIDYTTVDQVIAMNITVRWVTIVVIHMQQI